VPARGSDRDEAPHEILWAEHHAAGVALHSSPLSVAEPFQRHQQAHSTSWIFLSATLSVDGSFEHFKRSLGLDQASAQQWESPFDYERQSALWLATECGDPAASGFGHRIAEVIWPLLRLNGGRAFLLCTSLRMVTELATQIAERAHREPQLALEILVQGQGSRSELLERFRAAQAPVLIGSASFWEGVDVVGDQLSMVVIDKLPFAPPDDPLLKARIEACRRTGEDAFGLIQLPAAAMALKQGAGRLIRSETDRGLLVICDARLRTRGYGRKLLRSLPPFEMLNDQHQALAWLEARDAPSDAQAD
jgi:ATP-dependent DNA helicase DinG